MRQNPIQFNLNVPNTDYNPVYFFPISMIKDGNFAYACGYLLKNDLVCLFMGLGQVWNMIEKSAAGVTDTGAVKKCEIHSI